MTKSSVDRKRSRYGEKYSLRFYKQLKIYHLTCNDEIPSLIAKFVETDGYLAMKLFERLESNYKENEQLKQSISDWSGSYDGLYEDVKRLEKENEQLKQRNENQYNQLTELWGLIKRREWEILIEMDNKIKEDEERLRNEWKCYE